MDYRRTRCAGRICRHCRNRRLYPLAGRELRYRDNHRAAVCGNRLLSFGIRSHCFEVQYDEEGDRFLFTTYGYGHGVGMSQYGAHYMALDGYDYLEILEHYYTGVIVE